MSKDPILQGLVEKILLELLEAQHVANKASARLAEYYLNPPSGSEVPNLGFFPVPNPGIKSFDFSLKFLLKEFGSILRDDAKHQIGQLLIKLWNEQIEILYKENLIEKHEKKELLEVSPKLDYDNLFNAVESVEGEDISSLFLHEISKLFVTYLPDKIAKQKLTISKDIQALASIKEINDILFNASSSHSIPLDKVSAVFDLSQLNSIENELICGINIYVEMRNYETAQYSDTDEKGNVRSKAKILTQRR